jgi:uncharacterized repeat protein (TIGR01451 family)
MHRSALVRALLTCAIACVTALFLVTAAQAATFSVNSTADAGDSDTTDGVCNDGTGSCTLRAAIDEANAQAGPDTIQLQAGTYNLTNGGPGDDRNQTGDLDVNQAGPLTIQGATSNRNDTVISALDPGTQSSSDRVLHLLRNAEVTLNFVTISDGYTGGIGEEGAGIEVDKGASLVLNDSHLTNNDGGNHEAGGGINTDGAPAASDRSQVTIRRSLIDFNHAGDGGGGLNNNGDATVIDSQFENNSTVCIALAPKLGLRPALDNEECARNDHGESGGAIRQAEHAESLSVSGSSFTDNKAGDDGGAIEHHEAGPGGTATIANSTFTRNSAHDDGGALANSSGTMDITGSTFTDNFAHGRADGNCCDNGGGAIFSEGVAVKLTGSTLTGNTTDLRGGAIVNEQGRLDVIGSTIEGNTAEQSGGGIYVDGSSDGESRLTVQSSTIKNNTANGQCYFVFTSDDTDYYDCGPIEGYRTVPTGDPNPGPSDVGGGGIVNDGTHFQVLDSHIDENHAPNGRGGGIYQESGPFTLRRSSVDGNTAGLDGGGIANFGEPLSSNANSISLNEAGTALNLHAAGLPVTGTGNGGGVYDGVGSGDFSGADANHPDALYLNTTISGNKAPNGDGGGVWVRGNSFTRPAVTIEFNYVAVFRNSTLADNESASDTGGGVYSQNAAVFLKNTLFNSNSPTDCAGTQPISLGNNIDTDDSCSLDTSKGDQIGVTDAKIGPLADNGGPTHTRTRALLVGSPAIDKADNLDCPHFDQRGGLRPPPPGSAGTVCDVGAYEGNSLADLSVTKSASAGTVTVGQNVTYTLKVTNNGPDVANLVSVSDTLPGGVTFVSASASQGSCSGSGPVTCAIGTLGVGASATVTIVVTTTTAGSKTDTAAVTAPLTDPNAQNDTASATTAVASVAQAPVECRPSVPRTSISRNGLDAKRTTIKLVGRTIDFRCAGLNTPGGIRRVRLAIALLDGNQCRFLTHSGGLTAARSCKKYLFFTARLGRLRNGKVPWTFRVRNLSLPSGRYVAFAFGTDSQNAKETKTRRFNRKVFRIG